MTDALSPSVGLGVLHLFTKIGPLSDRDEIIAAVDKARADGDQVIPVSILGHKADVAFMALSEDLWRLRRLQTDLVDRRASTSVDSYVSLTEISEYAAGVPEEMRNNRLYPQLPHRRTSPPGASTR